jgi:hypothetical protein
MPDERFGIDLSNWRTLAPARRGALTRLLIQRVGAARSRDIGKALLAALGEAGEWLCVLARQRRPVLFPRRAASWPRPARRRKEL